MITHVSVKCISVFFMQIHKLYKYVYWPIYNTKYWWVVKYMGESSLFIIRIVDRWFNAYLYHVCYVGDIVYVISSTLDLIVYKNDKAVKIWGRVLQYILFNIKMGALWKKMWKQCFALFILMGSMKCNRGQLYTAKMWAWIVKFVWTGKSMLVIMAMRESDLYTTFENIPTNC